MRNKIIVGELKGNKIHGNSQYQAKVGSFSSPSQSSSIINQTNKLSGPFKNVPLSGNNHDTHKIHNLTSNESEKFTKAVNEYHQKKNNMSQQRSSQLLNESK